MGKIVHRLFIFTAVLLMLGLAGVGINTAQAETLNLKYGGLYPPAHPMSVAVQEWVNKIEKESNGQVKIQIFWAGALYKPKESAMEIAKGVVDAGDFSGAYAPVGFDFEKSMRMVFWGVDDRKLAMKVYRAVEKKFPQVAEEFVKGGIKVLGYASIPPYNVMLAKKQIRKASDFKGLTIKATGDMAKMATLLGAEGINMPMSETYTSLQKNTIDGLFAPYETMKSFRFAEVVKYAVDLNIAAAPAGHWGYCYSKFVKLPKNIQKLFDDNLDWFSNRIEELVYAGTDEGLKLAKENNVVFSKMPRSELNKVYAVVDKTVREKMKELDEKGLEGTKVYNEIRRLIKVYGKGKY